MDDKKFEINTQEPTCTGVLKSLNALIETGLYKMQKYENLNFVLIMV